MIQQSAADASPPTKAALMSRIERSWSVLAAAIDGLDEARMMTPGPDGWSIKDQLAHVAVWERLLIALLAGRSRAGAIGVDEFTHEDSDVDALNAIIFARASDRSLAAVLADSRRTHDVLLAVLGPLTDADLLTPYSHFQSHDPRHNFSPVIT